MGSYENETSFIRNEMESVGYFFSAEKKWINRIKKLSKEYPDQVKITYVNKDGSIKAELPKDWFRIAPKRKVNRVFTEEQKAAAAERMKKMLEAKRAKSMTEKKNE